MTSEIVLILMIVTDAANYMHAVYVTLFLASQYIVFKKISRTLFQFKIIIGYPLNTCLASVTYSALVAIIGVGITQSRFAKGYSVNPPPTQSMPTESLFIIRSRCYNVSAF